MDHLVSLLRFFGITESETKVYVALLQNGSRTGYEVSKFSGVPRSKVYNVLETLCGKGFVVYTHSKKTMLYKAEPARQVINHLRLQSDSKLELLENEISDFDHPVDNEQIWQLRGYDNVINKCELLIREAKEEIMIQVWANELSRKLEDLLLERRESGVKVLAILYDESESYNTRLKEVYRHGFEADKLQETGSRWITITVDQREMCYALVREVGMADGICTQNRSMVFFAHEYIRHDAYCLRMIQMLGPDVKKFFGEDMEGIRDVFSI